MSALLIASIIVLTFASGKRIVICWIPSHVDIPGNEKADSAAKSALTLPITKMKIPPTEFSWRFTILPERMAGYRELL